MTPRVPRLKRGSRRVRFYGCTAVLLLLLVICTPLCAGIVSMVGLLYRPCDGDPSTPSDFGLTWEDVRLEMPGKSVKAFFIPGSNGAAVIIPPTTGASRGGRFDEAIVLARHGYAILKFDSRRCSGQGPLTLGYKEAQDVRAALDFLLARDDVEPQRIGILGFSSAGAASVMAAAQFSEIRAVVAEGGYGDFADGAVGMDTRTENFLEDLYKWSLSLSYRVLTGVDMDRLAPEKVIAQIAPRPVLLIYGSTEPSLDDAYRQLEAAGSNTELWVVEGARHGNYIQIAPQEFETRVISFFDQALLSGG